MEFMIGLIVESLLDPQWAGFLLSFSLKGNDNRAQGKRLAPPWGHGQSQVHLPCKGRTSRCMAGGRVFPLQGKRAKVRHRLPRALPWALLSCPFRAKTAITVY